MVSKKDIEQRLRALDWTLYRLAKEFAQLRAGEKEAPPASRYHTSLGKAIDNPGTSKLETIKDIVQVLIVFQHHSISLQLSSKSDFDNRHWEFPIHWKMIPILWI